jgi:hypothetical protein
MNTQILNEYQQKITILAILCSKTSKHYSTYKNTLVLPNILITAALTILNSIITDVNNIKLVNISLSASSTLLIALDKSFQFSEKASLFFKSSTNLITLSHSIDKYKVNPTNDNSNEFVNHLINQYDSIIENITYEIPSYIIDNVLQQFDDNMINEIQLPIIMLTSGSVKIKKNKISPNMLLSIPTHIRRLSSKNSLDNNVDLNAS